MAGADGGDSRSRSTISEAANRLVATQAEPLDLDRLMARFGASMGEAGAVVTFTGICRSEAGRLVALELEHYPGMAETEIGRLVDITLQRWPLTAVLVVHRYGLIAAGEPIVFLATASSHRIEAFAAAEHLMDFMKTSAPFWKREHLSDGTIGSWVAPKTADDTATARWTE